MTDRSAYILSNCHRLSVVHLFICKIRSLPLFVFDTYWYSWLLLVDGIWSFLLFWVFLYGRGCRPLVIFLWNWNSTTVCFLKPYWIFTFPSFHFCLAAGNSQRYPRTIWPRNLVFNIGGSYFNPLVWWDSTSLAPLDYHFLRSSSKSFVFTCRARARTIVAIGIIVVANIRSRGHSSVWRLWKFPTLRTNRTILTMVYAFAGVTLPALLSVLQLFEANVLR